MLSVRQRAGGLSEGDFLNTFYIRQAQAQTDSRLGEHLRDYLVRVEQSGGTQTDVTAAVDQLKKRHRELQAERKQKLDKISGLVADNRQEAEFVRSEIGRLQARLRESQQERPVTFERRLQTGFGQPAASETDNRQEGHAGGQPSSVQTAQPRSQQTGSRTGFWSRFRRCCRFSSRRQL